MSGVEHWHRVQQFLFHEARLLDERRLEEWLALYADDAEYWVPYAWGQASPKDHVSLFYETKSLLGMRIDRLARELSPLDSPAARVNRLVASWMPRNSGAWRRNAWRTGSASAACGACRDPGDGTTRLPCAIGTS